MSGKINFLSAKKVKLHGMTSSRWTTRDKIIQYKGLINLYTRDRNIIEVDSNVARKKLHRELKSLQKYVENDRNELDNAIRGDKQKLRNTLSEHRELQLAYQNSQPKKVIEAIEQINFNKRKALDKLTYEMDQKSQQLIDLKLKKAKLEDNLKFAYLGQLKEEDEAQIITGKVQDAILRQEAAVAIKQTYAQMIAIMKRDAIYFDAVLATIQNDGLAQSKCFLKATKLGQLATEYLDDRRQEYTTLEKIIIKDMTTRRNDLAIVREQAENATISIKQLLRRDSDVNTCAINIETTSSETQLQSDLAMIERSLQFLKHATLVPSFEAIYPCLQEQSKQGTRLKMLAGRCEKNRDIILNKLNHAELMDNVLKNSMVETTGEYKTKKAKLIRGIERTSERIDDIKDQLIYWINLKAEVRLGLGQLTEFCRPIRLEAIEKREKKKSGTFTSYAAQDPTPAVSQPEKEEINGCKMIPPLIQKLTILMSNVKDKLDATKGDEAYKIFENLMKERRLPYEEKDKELTEESLLQGLYTEVSHQLTREDIKKQSAEIVAANTKNEDLIPVFQPPKRKMKLK